MIQAIHTVIQKRRDKPGDSRPDLLQHLINEGNRPDNGQRMTTRDIIDQMSELLLAGSETTSGTIACLFLELIRNPEVKERLLATLPVLSPNDPIIDGKFVRSNPRFSYLSACIKETLRLHPIASEMGRQTGKDWVSLMGYNLPPHTVVSASYRHLHRDSDIWDKPLRFYPERWIGQDKENEVPHPDLQAYYPFSAGKHSCIGINFAWNEMRMVAANLLSRYDFTEVPGQEVDYRQYITMQFKTGSWKVSVKPRY
ncbi:probable cytochrome P450 110 [Aspergillus udagawae]|uniref:Probable cytochrome P450 110 n=1 Tax=Aspergillus udagawae TaxID=91492 RepID=A0ABQ1BE75_9EURO|nr:probable cytochrome P450 110 [Aspergillus udagawae]GFF99776.1 probable cytochrome P450 110 [Aspergillus udagawae]